MVYLALTPIGARDVVALAASGKIAVWLNAGALDATEVRRLRESGLNISTFSRPINLSDAEAIAHAVATICTHHPGQTVWVEHSAAA